MRRSLALLVIVLLVAVVALPSLIIEIVRLWQPEARVVGQGPVVRLLATAGEVRLLPLEEYLVGVVAAEMPAAFEPEALKAQAIAARTYAQKRIEAARRQPDARHPQAEVCADAGHCQAWEADAELRDKWGLLDYLRYRGKIEQAVTATSGLILTYRGELIDPVYHSASGSRTESAAAVWGYDVPYLVSVASPWDRASPHYRQQATFGLAELGQRLGVDLQALPAAAFAPPKGEAIKVLAYTPSGRVQKLRVGNRTLSGLDFRRALNLASTDFTWQVKSGQIVFTCVGRGHGVGLSQYGANGLAREGHNFATILAHYYPGTKLEKR